MGILSNLISKITTKTLEGKNRQDKNFQSTLQSLVEKGKKVTIEDVKSSRYQKKGSDTYYGPTDTSLPYEAMKEQSVSSSAVEKVSYDPKTNDLTIKFRNNNKKYVYPDVPEEVFAEFMESPSKGRYVNKVIKGYGV